MFVELEGGAPPPPPPAPAQLVIANEHKKMIVIKSRLRRLRVNASGSRKRPGAMKSMRDEEDLGARSAFCAEAGERPVAICAVTLPVALAETTSLAGLKVQAELDGSELQAKVKVPLDPLNVARLNVKLAVWPLETV